MKSLIQSLKWDENIFNLEYDLDRYNIVIVHDFNMGAMENKSLNIFNSKYVLANNDIATDTDYQELFHMNICMLNIILFLLYFMFYFFCFCKCECHSLRIE